VPARQDGPSVFNRYVAAFDVAQLAQPLVKRAQFIRACSARSQPGQRDDTISVTGCVNPLIQPLSWPAVRTGSSAHVIGLSISRPLFPKESGLYGRCRSHAALRKAALASSRVSATPPFEPCDGARLFIL